MFQAPYFGICMEAIDHCQPLTFAGVFVGSESEGIGADTAVASDRIYAGLLTTPIIIQTFVDVPAVAAILVEYKASFTRA